MIELVVAIVIAGLGAGSLRWAWTSVPPDEPPISDKEAEAWMEWDPTSGEAPPRFNSTGTRLYTGPASMAAAMGIAKSAWTEQQLRDAEDPGNPFGRAALLDAEYRRRQAQVRFTDTSMSGLQVEYERALLELSQQGCENGFGDGCIPGYSPQLLSSSLPPREGEREESQKSKDSFNPRAREVQGGFE